MCFVYYYEWTAEVEEEYVTTAASGTRCDECHRPILTGATVHHLDQQEHEECQTCRDGVCGCPRDADGDCVRGCECEEPDHGVEERWRFCDDCHLFLRAVEAAEADCPKDQRRPPLGMMVEVLREVEDAERYFEAARRLYPQLEASGYLEWLGKRLRWED